MYNTPTDSWWSQIIVSQRGDVTKEQIQLVQQEECVWDVTPTTSYHHYSDLRPRSEGTKFRVGRSVIYTLIIVQ